MAKANVEAKSGNVMDFLKGAAKKEPASKSKVTTYQVSDDLKDKATRMWQIKQAQTELEAEWDALKADMMQGLEPVRFVALKSEGYHASGRIATLNDHWVIVSYSDRYEKIPADNEEILRNLVGKDYDSLFELRNDIKVRSDLSEAELTSIVEAIGYDNFVKYFDVRLSIKPTTKYTQEKHNIFKNDKLSAIGSIVRQIFSFRTK